MKTVSAQVLTKAYLGLYPEEMRSEKDIPEVERILGNWLDSYKTEPERKISVYNWCGKVTKALFLALNLKMPRTKTEMLKMLA